LDEFNELTRSHYWQLLPDEIKTDIRRLLAP
jgi:hypothetical protein